MKTVQSPEHWQLSLSHSMSRLRRFRDDAERPEAVSFGDVASKSHVSEDQLSEMESRAKSRLGFYSDMECMKAGRLSTSLHSFSYGPTPSRNSMLVSPCPPSNRSFNASWQFYNFVGADESEVVYNGSNRKPSEAVLTIDGRTSQILVANQTACRLFAYKEEELCSMKISELFTMKDGIKQEILMERHVDTDGNVVMASGKVLEGIDKDGNIIVVSVWMKRLTFEDNFRCVVIMEPIEVTKASFLFNAEGIIEDCDVVFSTLHGYDKPEDVIGRHINKVVPAMLLPTPGETIPKNIRKQRATSRTRDTIPFPTTIKINEHDPDFHQLYLERTPESRLQLSKLLYKGFMWVFTNISGLVSVFDDGAVHACNENFIRTFLGHTESDIVGKNITLLIPHFFEQIELLCDEASRVQSRNSMAINEQRSVNSSLYHQSANSAVDSVQTDVFNQPDSTHHKLQTNDRKQQSILDNRAMASTFSKKAKQIDTVNKNDSIVVSGLSEFTERSSNPDGFFPHLKSSTPKQSENKVFNSYVENHPEKLKLNFENETAVEITENVDTVHAGSQSKQLNLPKDDTPTDLSVVDPLENLFSSFEHPDAEERRPVSIVDSAMLKSVTVDEIEFSRRTEDELTISSREDRSSYYDTPLVKKAFIKRDTETMASDFEHLRLENADDYTEQQISSNESSASILSVLEQEVDCEPPSIDEKKYCKETLSHAVLELHEISHHRHERRFAWEKDEKPRQIVEGIYYGQARHRDESMLPILFEVKKLSSKDKKDLFCVWISRDPDEDAEFANTSHHLMSSYNSTFNTSTGNFQQLLKSMKDTSPDDPGHGLYNENFITLSCIGKGAFGFVNLAQRKTNNAQVVVKFIRKDKVLKDSWIEDSVMGRVPFEIHLLSQIDHHNIVKMLEALENDNYFHLVMEKHGDGIDLFEFIDRKPKLDEALASYMFRQVLQATDYLHQENILHRDIKDENIIVDRAFNLKLIDFGSATTLVKGKLFNTFCGTVEYCSPEVLLGNWYEGRELEMWSLGVTLYTFIFGEHPFFEVEETIRAELFPPFKVSNELMFVICWMLHPEVEFRAKLSDIIGYPWFTRPVDITQYDYDIVIGNDSTADNNIGHDHPTAGDDRNQLDNPNIQQTSYRISCSPVGSSLSSSSSSTPSETSTGSDDADSQHDVMLKDQFSLCLPRTDKDKALSKSF